MELTCLHTLLRHVILVMEMTTKASIAYIGYYLKRLKKKTNHLMMKVKQNLNIHLLAIQVAPMKSGKNFMRFSAAIQQPELIHGSINMTRGKQKIDVLAV